MIREVAKHVEHGYGGPYSSTSYMRNQVPEFPVVVLNDYVQQAFVSATILCKITHDPKHTSKSYKPPIPLSLWPVFDQCLYPPTPMHPPLNHSI
jgi:hypothetical protein